MMDFASRLLLIALVALTLGKLAFYSAEWAIRRAAPISVAIEGKRPAIRLAVPTETKRDKLRQTP